MNAKIYLEKIHNHIRPYLPGGGKYIIEQLKKGGAEIGKGVIIYDPASVLIDSTRPWLLKIGEYTKITHGVIILTHDYSLSTLRRKFGLWIGEGRVTSIGNNCFIGVNSIILMGACIGDNVIVGAGSVVHGTIPSNVVVAGNPARIVCTLEEHYNNRLMNTEQEAIECARRFKKIFGRSPSPKDLEGFKFLFTPRNKKIVSDYGLSFFCNGDEPKEVEKAFYESEPRWGSFDQFLDTVNNQ